MAYEDSCSKAVHASPLGMWLGFNKSPHANRPSTIWLTPARYTDETLKIFKARANPNKDNFKVFGEQKVQYEFAGIQQNA